MGLFAYHDSHNLGFRSPFGAVACEQTVTFRLLIHSEIPIESCFLRLWEKDRERSIPMFPQSKGTLEQAAGEQLIQGADSLSQFPEPAVVYEAEYKALKEAGVVWYYFKLLAGGQTFYYGNNDNCLGGEGKLEEAEPSSYQITVYHPTEIPSWYRQGIMYQIFVDRFFGDRAEGFDLYPRKNALLHADWYDTPIYIKDQEGRVTHWDFFGGNLSGVLKKLPYLKELGISILYLNPIFEASSNHKYDTADYHRIDPMYGDEKIFEALTGAARQYGIKVVLDGVFSHTGSDSLYFNRYGNYPSLGAYQSPESPYYQWYQFKPGTKDYKSWWNVDALPEVDELNPTYQEFLFNLEKGVIAAWMKKGAAGWRLDVADELPDEFIKKLRKTVKALNPEAVLIGEVWEDASNKHSYGKLREYFWGYELDATMNYPFRDIFLSFLLGRMDSSTVHQRVMSLYENYPKENFYAAMNLIGSHDRERILTLLGDAPDERDLPETQKRIFRLSSEARKRAVQRLKLFSLIQMTFPGVPCVYYGDEAGAEGYSDPYNRGTYPWGREDNDLLQWYKKIIRLRQEYEVLQSGDFQSFYEESDVYGLRRFGNGEDIVVLLNRHVSQSKEVKLPQQLYRDLMGSSLMIDLLSGRNLTGKIGQALSLDPLSALVLFCKKGLPAFPQQDFSRSSGILMHISSLPSKNGLGDMGDEAYHFIDFLVDSGQSFWQMLPLNPVGLGDSPYQSDSAFAGNLRLISMEYLIREGLLQADFTERMNPDALSPEIFKETGLRKAFKVFIARIQDQEANNRSPESDFLSRSNYLKFHEDNREWLDDYVLYRALKTHFEEAAWYEWEPELAWRKADRLAEYSGKLKTETEFHRFVQYTFYYQWQELRKYAQAKGVKLIGDLPIFVSADSCDVWVHNRFFKLDEFGRPAKVAGVPPDYFSATGQLWGNPVYDWDALASEDYAWWKQRIKFVLRLFDYLRIDHFRGFEAYWEVDAGEETAINGHWIKGPGKHLFESLAAEFGQLPFIAEDLGFITADVHVLKQIFGFPGMKVLQFTKIEEVQFDEDSNIIYYSGTHDNDTLLGWYRKYLKGNTPMSETPDQIGEETEPKIKEACRKLIESLYLSPAQCVITPMQDILGLDTDARMNLPGTTVGNWKWQLNQEMLTPEVEQWLRAVTMKAKRLPAPL